MPSKRKDLLKPKSKSKGKIKASEPQTENDFMEAADEHELAAGKWRAGDVEKCVRFLNRAFETYNEGLKHYPQSFDLAYNKATLQLDIARQGDSRVVAHFGSRTALLEETLRSHRFAISLNPINTNIIFNYAQALDMLADAGSESGALADGTQISLLEEAVGLFMKCLESQQQEYSQMQVEIAKMQTSEGYEESRVQPPPEAQSESTETEPSTSETPEDWATVEEPPTPETMLDTCTAQLETLTKLLGLYDVDVDRSSVEKMAQNGLNTVNSKIPTLIELVDGSPAATAVRERESGPTLSIGSSSTTDQASTTSGEDAILAGLNFQESIAAAQYRGGLITSTKYAQDVEQIFSSVIEDTAKSARSELASINAQSAYADALLSLAAALSGSPQYTASSPTFAKDIEIQWTALTQAQDIVTRLSSAPHTSILSAARLAPLFIGRGDADLFRFRISLLKSAKPAWKKSGPTLVANAGVFYRGGRAHAEKAGTTQDWNTADARATVAEILKEVASGSGVIKDTWKGRSEDVAKELEQMVDEGIVARENVDGVLQMTQ